MPTTKVTPEVSGAMAAPDALATIRDLLELVDAIDRRAPQLQRTGEAEIATTALRLRVQAVTRIAELKARTGAQT